MGRKHTQELLLYAKWLSFVLIFFITGISTSFGENTLLNDAPDEEGGGLIKMIIEANLKRDVFFSFRPDLIGVPGIDFNDFRILENKAYLKEHPYLKPYAMGADQVSARVNPLTLFLGRITLTDLKVKNPEVQFAVDDKLRTNFDDILDAQKSNMFINWIRVNKLSIDDARMHIYTDIIFSKYQEFFLTDIDVKMRNIIKGKTADVSIKALTPGAEKQNAFMEGTVGPIVSMAQIEKSPMNLKLSIIDAPLEIKDLVQIPPEIEDHTRLKKIIGLPENGRGNMEIAITGDYDKGIVGDGAIHLTDVYLSNLDNSAKGEKFDAEIRCHATASILKETINFNELHLAVVDNCIDMKGTIDNLLHNVRADLKVTSEGFDLLSLQKIYPFYQAASGIEPVGGNIQFALDLGGDLEKGFNASGQITGNDIQLYDKKRDIKGIPLNASFVITEKPIYHVRDSLLEINQVDMNLGSSHIKAKGKVEEFLGENRRMRATAFSDKLNVPEIMEFVPLLKSLNPEGGKISGFMAFKCDVDTNVMQTEVVGEMDLKEADFKLENFAQKKKGSKCIVNFKSLLDLDQLGTGEATIILENGIIHDPYLFTKAFSFLMKGATKTQNGKKIFAWITGKEMVFKNSTIKATYLGNNKFNGEILVSGVNPSAGYDMTIRIKGKLDLDGFMLDGQGLLEMSPEISRDVIAVTKKARKFIRPRTEGDIIVLPFSAGGTLTAPEYKFGVCEGRHIVNAS